MSRLETLATKTFPKQEIIQEGSWGARGLGAHELTMILYRDGSHVFIEWDFPSLEMTEHVGLELEGQTVVGYDGVMSFPNPAYEWLRELGYSIAEDVI